MTCTRAWRRQVDSPSWHLVQALNTLIEKDGHTVAVEGFFEKAKPLSAAQISMIEVLCGEYRPEATIKVESRRRQLGA